MHQPESVLKNETQTGNLIPARRANWVMIKKKITFQVNNFIVQADYKLKMSDGEKLDKYLDLARKLKKL